MKADWARWLGWLQATALLCAPAVAMPAALALHPLLVAPVYGQLAAAPGPGPAPVPGPGPAADPAVPPAAPPPAPEPSLPERIRASLDQDQAVLRDAARSQAEREEAARKLIFARQSSAAADDRILQALNDNTREIIQAIGRAVADDPTPDPRLIPRFSVQLGQTDRATTEAAAMALTAYKENEAALKPLLDFVKAPAKDREAQRAAAVRALGAVPAQRVAQQLVQLLLNDPEEIVKDAAADGLVQMTGIRENGRDAAAWRQWWAMNAPDVPLPNRKTALQFKAALADRRPAAPAALADLDATVRELYRLASPAAAKAEALTRVLNSSDAPIRAAGVRLILAELPNAGRVPAGALPRLPEMISDSSAEVRAEVARTLRVINHVAAQDALIVQLAQEPDPAVRIAMMEALVPMRDQRAAAVPVLLDLLKDPSLGVATVAAETIAKMGDVIRLRPNVALRNRVVGDLQQALNGKAKQPGAEDFRGACVEALVSLADRQDPKLGPDPLGQLFFALVKKEENKRVRMAALQGVGVVGDNRHANPIMDFLQEEPEGTVRLVGMQTMGEIGAFTNIKEILEYTKPAKEKDTSVQEAAVAAFVKLLPKAADREALVALLGVQLKDEIKLRLPVLFELARRQEAEGLQQELQHTRQNIGGIYRKLGQPKEAVPYFRQALDYFLAQPNVPAAALENLIKDLMESLLASKQFAEAVKFAQTMIARDPASERTLGGIIVNEAARLLDEEKKPREAEALIAEAQRMSPPLRPDLFGAKLAELKARIPAPTSQPSQ